MPSQKPGMKSIPVPTVAGELLFKLPVTYTQ